MLSLFIVSLAIAQAYEGSACDQANPRLKEQLDQGVVPALFLGFTGDWAKWSTSFLKAEGKPPHKRAMLDAEDELNNGVMEYDKWSCQHSAQALVDHDPKTAWAEGVPGNGVGEVVLAPIDLSRPVRIWGGLGASDALFAANARPKRVRVWVLHTATTGPTQTGVDLSTLRVLGKHEVELKDVNAFQPLPLPKVGPPSEGQFVVGVEILSVYGGGRFSDTCISELGN